MLCAEGHLFLIDCGEGTQQQMRRMHLSFVKVEAVFISHIHGDHIFGIFGLLNSMSMYGRTAPLYIYGPRAVGSVLNFYKSCLSGGKEAFEIIFTPVNCKSPTPVHTSRHVRVSAFPLHHHIECYGYRFDEIPNPKRPSTALEVPLKSYAYCSDTETFPELAEWVRGVDLLYHEATYTSDMADKAAYHHHSTTVQAARCALDAGVKQLVVGHYSSRIRDFASFLKECTEIFPNTVAANDCDVFSF